MGSNNRIKEHGPVRTMDDVKRVLDAADDCMVKSILIAISKDPPDPEESWHQKNLFLIGISADRNLDFSKLATMLGVPRKSLQMATQMQVEEITGFRVGSIPPFGLPKNIPVILDARIADKTTLWCGTGKSTESIRLSLDELKLLSTPTFGDLSRPK